MENKSNDEIVKIDLSEIVSNGSVRDAYVLIENQRKNGVVFVTNKMKLFVKKCHLIQGYDRELKKPFYNLYLSGLNNHGVIYNHYFIEKDFKENKIYIYYKKKEIITNDTDPYGEEDWNDNLDDRWFVEFVEKNENYRMKYLKKLNETSPEYRFSFTEEEKRELKRLGFEVYHSIATKKDGKYKTIMDISGNQYHLNIYNNNRKFFKRVKHMDLYLFEPMVYWYKEFMKDRTLEKIDYEMKHLKKFTLNEKSYNPIKDDFVIINYDITNEPVPAQIIKVYPNNTYLVSFNVEGSPVKGAPNATIRNSDIISPYKPIKSPVGTGFISANTNMSIRNVNQVSNDMYL